MQNLGVATRSVVTFLFTDIEGSTRSWEDHPDEMEVALARHDALLHRAIEGCGGVVFKTVGDAFCASFTAASDGVQAAAAAQLALQEEAWPPPVTIKARMAIHTGECTRRDDDFFGPTVNRVARLLAIGHGGQVLVSSSARSMIGTHVPSGVSLRDLGAHRLKDIGEPEQVYHLCAPGLEDVTRPLRSVEKPRLNLPAQLTSFVGRESEDNELRALLSRQRLVTLTGAGGCGKTRLALRVAERVGSAGDGVWFVGLASVRDPELVPDAVAAALDVRAEGARDVPAELITALRDRDVLLVLDNCEHVLDASAALVDALLRTCVGVTVLATSREPLGVDGESVYWLRSLTVPEPGVSDPSELAACEAVELLVDRVRVHQPRFAVDASNAATVAEICRRLDGIPLALELVAARAGALTLEELSERLDERFQLLTRGSRSALPRHQTLRALIDWSYDLLSPAEQRTLARCAVFAGSFDLDAAEAVCGREPIDVSDVLDHITALAAKNLIQRDEALGRTRYRLLESVRHYATDQLLRLEGELDTTRMTHCDHYVDLAEHTEAQLFGPRAREGFERLTGDVDNLRAALTWSTEQPERSEHGLRLAGALAQFWFMRGLYREGLDQTTELLTFYTAANPIRAKALWSAGFLATLLGDGEAAQPLLDEALDIARRTADRGLIARCLDLLGLLAFFRNELPLARRLLEESIREARAIDDRWFLADASGTLGSILPLVGEFELAEKYLGEALAIAREARDEQGVRMALFGIALTASRQDDLATLLDAAEEGLEICRSIGDAWFISYFLWLLAIASVQVGNLERAREQADESLTLARVVEGPLLIVCALEAVASVERATGDEAAAVSALEEARRVGRAGAVPGAYLASVTHMLGELAAEAGHADEAATLLTEAADIARAVGDEWGVARALTTLDGLPARRDA